MEEELVEIASGTFQTPDGQTVQIDGGAYLTPEAYLRTQGELERLRHYRAEVEASRLLPALVFAAGAAGVMLGFWLGRRSTEDDE